MWTGWGWVAVWLKTVWTEVWLDVANSPFCTSTRIRRNQNFLKKKVFTVEKGLKLSRCWDKNPNHHSKIGVKYTFFKNIICMSVCENRPSSFSFSWHTNRNNLFISNIWSSLKICLSISFNCPLHTLLFLLECWSPEISAGCCLAAAWHNCSLQPNELF